MDIVGNSFNLNKSRTKSATLEASAILHRTILEESAGFYIRKNRLRYEHRTLSKADMPPEARRTFTQEFFDFLKTFGIIGLAIAFVIGQAASRLVTAFVNDIIDPIIGFFLPAGSLEAVSFKVTNLAGTTTEFKYGDLISNIIDFVIIALLVFLAYKQLSKRGFVEDKTKPATEEKK